MARCEQCDQESCKVAETEAAWQACRCGNDTHCKHAKALRAASDVCDAHAVNWRERALAAENRERVWDVRVRLPETWLDVQVAWDGTWLTAYLNLCGDWVERYTEEIIPVTLWRYMTPPPEVPDVDR